MQLFFSTTNDHKIVEMRRILREVMPEIEVLTLKERPELAVEVEETGKTYAENALLKARAYVSRVKMPVVTDDSGVEVAALPRMLGIYSTRWYQGNDHDRVMALLEKMKGVSDRGLIYRAAIAYITPEGEEKVFEGELHGRAATVPYSTEGFGYDPIFIPDGYDKTLVELGGEIKNRLSHRSGAARKLAAWLKEKAD